MTHKDKHEAHNFSTTLSPDSASRSVCRGTGKSKRSRRPARHSQPGQVMASLPVLRPDVHAYHVHVHPHTNIHVEEMRARETKL